MTIALNNTVDGVESAVYIRRSDFRKERRDVVITHVKFVSIPTRDQDAALAFYTEKLGFKLVTDQPFNEKQRWIEMRIGGSDTRFVLFTTDESRIGSFFAGALACDNVEKTYEELKARGVDFIMPPTRRDQEGIMLAVCADPDGLAVSFAQMLEAAKPAE